MSKIPYINVSDCIACGSCESLCPNVFFIDENLNYAVVTDPHGASEEEIQEAIDICPAGCISWKEEE